jgi:hypothetical protein
MGEAHGGTKDAGENLQGHLRVTFVLTDAATAEEARDGETLAPTELLGAASAVRSDETLRKLGVDRFGVLDRGLERLGEAAVADRLHAAGAAAVVLAGGRNAAGGLEDLIGVGRRLNTGRAPVRIALVGDRPEDAAAVVAAGAADVALVGDADESLPRALEAALRSPADGGEPEAEPRWAGVPGACWQGPTGAQLNGPPARPARVQAAPAWDLVDLRRYAASGGESGVLRPAWSGRRALRSATVRTSRACAPGCRTCHQSFGSSARDRSVRDVVAELRDLVHRRGVRRLLIADHGFDGRPERAAEIARAVARLRSAPGRASLSLEFPRGLRGDGLTPEVVEAFLAAGVRRFPIHAVTASRRLQRLLKSNIDLRAAAAGIERVQASSGALVHLELRLGLPTETAGETAATIRWAQSTAAHTAAFLPGRDVNLGPAWTASEGDEHDDYPALRRRALLAFYGSPRRAARLSRSIPRLLPDLIASARPPLKRLLRGLS